MADGKYNVLFIAVDDLRPQMGCYGVNDIRTPHMDRLASEGVVFEKAYCQQAVCNPSRASLLTGRRPDTTGVWDLETHFREKLPDVVTLPQHFKNHGYTSVGLGKIYHGQLQDPPSWSTDWWIPEGLNHSLDPVKSAEVRQRAQALGVKPFSSGCRGPSWEEADVPDNAYGDGRTAERAIENLERLKDGPFFLGVGFSRPHLPFNAPKRYYDLYPKSQFSLPRNYFFPAGVPSIALHDYGELRFYSDIPKQGAISDEKALELIRAYYACTTFIDAQVGGLLDTLKRLKLDQNTIVVLWGDHGWHLGEHNLWCKHSNFEIATRSPLILTVPGMTKGIKTGALTEFVDIYPTLCELCNLPLPDGLEGASLAPLLRNPAIPWKKAAFSQQPRKNETVMGYSMRTDRYRYTEWLESGRAIAAELYDYDTDPLGNVNIAGQPENARLVAELGKMLHLGWKHVAP